MKRKLFQPHYDSSFKKKVIEEYLATGCSKMSLLRKYNIHFKSAIQTWMRVLGYGEAGERAPKVTFGTLTLTSLSKKKKASTPAETPLEQELAKLKLLLEDEKLRSEAYARMIDKAEKELKISIRKKFATK